MGGFKCAQFGRSGGLALVALVLAPGAAMEQDLPVVASFFVRGKELRVPRGLRMTWRTRSILHGVDEEN